MPSSTVENYLKRIYAEQMRQDQHLVPMGQLANAMSVAPGTATAMVKTLADAKLVEYAPRDGVRLTPEGRQLALGVLRRHRLVELFLVNVLGMDWSQVHEEAEELEHAISDNVLQHIDTLLGHPDTDPHGDPIPPADGEYQPRSLPSLAACHAGDEIRVARVADQEPHFLQFVDQHGLMPGAHATVLAQNPSAQALTVQPHNAQPVTIGLGAATKILVEPPIPTTPTSPATG